MIPINQTKLHDPPNTIGNCMVAAFASILEIDIDEIPCFEDMPKYEWFHALEDWLDGLGFFLLRFNDPVFLPVYYIANGPSPRGVSHSVVYIGEHMAHDPHPSGDGILEVKSSWALIPYRPDKFKTLQTLAPVTKGE